MAASRLPALRYAPNHLSYPFLRGSQKRWAQVHDVRFLVTHHRSERLLEKYKDKLDRKVKRYFYSLSLIVHYLTLSQGRSQKHRRIESRLPRKDPRAAKEAFINQSGSFKCSPIGFPSASASTVHPRYYHSHRRAILSSCTFAQACSTIRCQDASLIH